MAKKSNTEEFVSKAKVIFGDSLDYSKVAYKGNTVKVTIICPKHGDFLISPTNHLSGKSCRKCAFENLANLRRSTTERFVASSKIQHGGDSFDYSQVIYKSAHSKVKIRCNTCHTVFEQKPNNHLNGQGCIKCAGVGKSNTEEFIGKSITEHGSVYDYSEVVYTGVFDKVKILCRYHGPFFQIPASHLRGQGCSKCAKSGYKSSLPATFYLFNISNKYLGFGITNDFKTRHTNHKTTFKKHSAHAELITTYELSGTQALAIENRLKKSYEIIDTGIEGFRKEATDIKHLPAILEDIKKFLDTI